MDDGDPGALASRAALVRDYLVTVRGGAPFLSGADDRLLLSWLEEGVPEALILSAVDAVAEDRRRKKVRARLTLSACKKAVEKARAAVAVDLALARRDPATGPAAGLALLAEQVEAAPVDAGLVAARDRLVAVLRALAPSTAHRDEVGRAAAAAVTAFHVAAWQQATAEHAALRTQAEARLAPLRTSLRGPAWAEMVEEVARDLLRQRFPAVSARAVWDRLAP